MQPEGQSRGNPCSTSSARVPSRVDDASRHRQFASTQVRQWRQTRVLMRPEAAFPYVFAAEGAQHPPKKPPRSTDSPANDNSRHAQQPAATQPAEAATLNGQSRKRQQPATLNAQPQRPSAGAASRLFLGIEQIRTAKSLEGLDIRLPAGLDIR